MKIRYWGGLCCLALLAASTPLSSAQAAPAVVNPNLSSLTFTIDVGLYADPEDPNSFVILASAQPQGIVPVGKGKLPGPVTPGFSTGLSAQVAGKINLTPGAPGEYSIPSAALTLLDSGLWQPGTNVGGDPVDYDNVAVPADLGAFLEGYVTAEPPDPPDLYGSASLDDVNLSVATGTFTLGGGGSFSDPTAKVILNGGTIDLESNIASVAESITEPAEQVIGLAGTYLNQILTIPVSSSFDLPIPNDLIDVIARITITGTIETAIPGDANFDSSVDGGDYTLWADNFLETGTTWEQGDFNCDGIVDGGDYTIWADNFDPSPAMASAVPEPSTFALLGMGAAALLAVYRRRK